MKDWVQEEDSYVGNSRQLPTVVFHLVASIDTAQFVWHMKAKCLADKCHALWPDAGPGLSC